MNNLKNRYYRAFEVNSKDEQTNIIHTVSIDYVRQQMTNPQFDFAPQTESNKEEYNVSKATSISIVRSKMMCI